MTATDSLRVFQVVALYGVTAAEVNSAIDAGILRARDRRTVPGARHAYRIRKVDVEAWLAAGCPTA